MPFPAPNRREDNHGRRPYLRQGKVPKPLHFLNLGGSRSAGEILEDGAPRGAKTSTNSTAPSPAPNAPSVGAAGEGDGKPGGEGEGVGHVDKNPQSVFLLCYLT